MHFSNSSKDHISDPFEIIIQTLHFPRPFSVQNIFARAFHFLSWIFVHISRIWIANSVRLWQSANVFVIRSEQHVSSLSWIFHLFQIESHKNEFWMLLVLHLNSLQRIWRYFGINDTNHSSRTGLCYPVANANFIHAFPAPQCQFVQSVKSSILIQQQIPEIFKIFDKTWTISFTNPL